MKTELIVAALRRRVNKVGILTLTNELGYTGPNTVKVWLSKAKIPNCRREKVIGYLKKRKEL